MANIKLEYCLFQLPICQFVSQFHSCFIPVSISLMFPGIFPFGFFPSKILSAPPFFSRSQVECRNKITSIILHTHRKNTNCFYFLFLFGDVLIFGKQNFFFEHWQHETRIRYRTGSIWTVLKKTRNFNRKTSIIIIILLAGWLAACPIECLQMEFCSHERSVALFFWWLVGGCILSLKVYRLFIIISKQSGI